MFFDCRPKKDILPRLEKEAAKLRGELLCVSSSSDPYPNIEAEYKLTRSCLKILSRNECKVQIMTKSPLVVRDADLLNVMSSMVSMTVTTLDDHVARFIEPGAPSCSDRLTAVKALIGKEVPVAVRVDPVVPFMNEHIEDLLRQLSELGVKHVTCSTLKLKPDAWLRLRTKLPQLAAKLKPMYFENPFRKAGSYYLSEDHRIKLMENAKQLSQKFGMKFATCREGLGALNSATCDGSWLIKEQSRCP
jgi:DNA repair photolyase